MRSLLHRPSPNGCYLRSGSREALTAFTAFTDSNADLGESLKARDKELDRLHKQMIASLSSRLETADGRAENLLHLIFVARSIERIGDLAVNIGEDAVFLGEARDIRHEHRKQANAEENPGSP